jgi:hypothetical protein
LLSNVAFNFNWRQYVLEGNISEFRSLGSQLTSGDVILLSEYLRINNSLKAGLAIALATRWDAVQPK